MPIVDADQCPNCGAPPENFMGVEITHLYDGTLYWHCLGCRHVWPRFPKGDRLYRVAMDFLNKHHPESVKRSISNTGA